MREEYDVSQSTQNPYAKIVKKQISLIIKVETIEYFKELSVKTGAPYKTLINSHLADRAMRHVQLRLKWIN